MKCNLTFENIATKKVKKEIIGFLNEEIKELIKQENTNCIRRLYKLLAITLNQRHGFGKKRIMDILDDCGEKALEDQKEDEIFWNHVDNIVINQIGLNFTRENYDLLDK